MYHSDLTHKNAPLQRKLESLYTLSHNRYLDLGFRPAYLNLLERLGHPHLRVPPVIHLAGTNGKGSTLSMLRSILSAAGYKVHAYTSPHLVRFNERIELSGQLIDDDQLEALIDEVLDLNGGAELSFFEITTALAFAAFARMPADVLLLETGLGGRLDCTNIVPSPIATVISSIAFDHQDYLGDAIEEIASEKAGIIKQGAPCVIGAQRYDAALDVVQKKADDVNVPCYAYGQSWSVLYEPNHTMFDFIWNDEAAISYPKPALIGAHQIQNAGLALATLRTAGDYFPKVNCDVIAQGLNAAQWPARLQNISALVPSCPSGVNIWLDGGHNEDAAQALLEAMRGWDGPIHLICGMMSHKDVQQFLRPLSQKADYITAVSIPHEPRALMAEEIVKNLDKIKIQCAHEPLDALMRALQDMQNGHVLICGSLYLAGYVLRSCSHVT